MTWLASRAIVRLSPQTEGEDVAAFLQGLVTNDIAGPLPAYAALLTPQGKLLFAFIIWREGADFLLDCEAEAAEALSRRMAMYRLRRAIDIRIDPTIGVHWALNKTGLGSPDPRLAALGWRWLGTPAGEDGEPQWLAHRLAAGVTEGRAEMGEGDLLWLETNAAELNGVSFAKGCYVGQENTARMNWRAKVNRRLIVVPLAQSDAARRRFAYPELGLAVDFLRTEAIAPQLCPTWLSAAN